MRQSKLEGHTDSVLCLSLSPDGTQLASGSEDCTARIWDLRTARSVRLLKCSEEVTSICYAPYKAEKKLIFVATADGRVLTFDLRNDSIILSVDKNHCVAEFSENEEEINQLGINEDGSLLAACDDNGVVKVFDTQNFTLKSSLNGVHDNLCNTVHFHRNSIVSGGLDARLVTWKQVAGDTSGTTYSATLETQVGLHIEKGAGGCANTNTTSQVMNPPFVYSSSLSPSGNYFAAGLGDGTVAFYTNETMKINASSHRSLGRFAAHSAGVNQVHFVDSKETNSQHAVENQLLVSSGGDLNICFWNCEAEMERKSVVEENLRKLEDVKTGPIYEVPDCDHCGMKGAGSKKCSRCLQAHYCSRSCQRAGWKGHKLQCKILAQNVNKNINEEEKSTIQTEKRKEGNVQNRDSETFVVDKISATLHKKIDHGLKINWITSSLEEDSGSLFVADTSRTVHVYSGFER
eukprot:g4847.t1